MNKGMDTEDIRAKDSLGKVFWGLNAKVFTSELDMNFTLKARKSQKRCERYRDLGKWRSMKGVEGQIWTQLQ